MRRLVVGTLTGCVCASWSGAAIAQVRLDQADPSIIERTIPDSEHPRPAPRQPTVEAEPTATATSAVIQRVATAIVVDGASHLPAGAFSDAVLPFVGRNLDQRDLINLANAVADVARRRGYLFASASVEPQNMSGGVLRVKVNEGKIDAVRVIGAKSQLADQILTGMLANGQAATRARVERAIQLVDDIPGIDVKESRFVRQDGFGILLVTIETDRASAYVQVDNRGTKEVGPIRATMIGSMRGLFRDGDELGLIASSTPLQASEFAFARARYSSVMDRFGSVLSLSTSYGKVRPGASLSQLDVIGHSLDVSVSYSRPIVRERAKSLWATAEFRALKVDQDVLGFRFRDDRLATLTASLNGFVPVADGVLRGEIGVTTGIPVAGATREGDPAASRSDGDARFVTAGYAFEWSRKLNGWLGVAVASSGQLASRPLLATAEIGVGGTTFGRAYDTAERTGDQGILGSFELRADIRKHLPSPISRGHLYGFVDGGYVDNLRDGVGGGTLASAGGGFRLGVGRMDVGAEIAVPLNADRFDTHDRSPRFSFRLARSF